MFENELPPGDAVAVPSPQKVFGKKLSDLGFLNDERNMGGRHRINDQFVRHRTALSMVKPEINMKAPRGHVKHSKGDKNLFG